MAGYTRQSVADIINGLPVTAPPLNAEFNQMAAAFNATTGHSHDGGTGNAPPIPLGTSVSGYLKADNGGVGGKNNVAATTAPAVTNDANQGYTPGSKWLDITNGKLYTCFGNAIGAAVWRETVSVTTTGVNLPTTNFTLNNLTVNGTADFTNTKLVNVSAPTLGSDAATKTYVDTAISNLVAAAPGTMDTLNELAAALGDDPNFATTVANDIGTKLSKSGGTMTGNIAMGGNKVTGLAAPTTGTDAVNKQYMDDLYGSTASAADSAAAAAASFDAFDDRYLGSKSSAPSLDNDGQALLQGALYWDTSLGKLRVWNGSSWISTDFNSSNVGPLAGVTSLTGTAVTQSATDATAGRLLTNGHMGLGVSITAPTLADLDATDTPIGWWLFTNGAGTKPAGVGPYSCVRIDRYNQNTFRQTWVGYDGAYLTRFCDKGVWGAWRRDYTSDNVVGTVANFGGSPSGAIIERGSNTNGEWMRFADGTQICWHDNIGSASVSTADGQIYKSGSLSWTFPAAFVDTDIFASGSPSANVRWCGASVSNPTTATFVQFAATQSGTAIGVRAFVIGRWY